MMCHVVELPTDEQLIRLAGYNPMRAKVLTKVIAERRLPCA
jgi:hypothetical protein